jgi:PIN domain nuclease of toxin-antitoxin system
LTILDAYAVLAFLKAEAAADDVEHLIRAGDAALTSLGVAEVLDHLIRIVRADEEEASLDLAQLGLDPPISLDEATAAASGRLRARHYHRVRRPVSLADCVAAEVARSLRSRLATSDPALLDLCHDENIAVIVLPGSDGSTWSLPQP